ncbi:hypothetical protein, partial [Pantoea sp. BAV 3049]|uniref:hypothetical protein n=1 Tax=Pantoea sp. BAV 3049 TaxID=2654188 RepID=UPI001E475879
LNPDYQPSAESLRQIANHQHLGLKTQPEGERPKPQNAVFDEYRSNSWMYEMDKSLREVRNAANLVHP